MKKIGIVAASILLNKCKTKIEEGRKMISEFDTNEFKTEMIGVKEKMKEEFKILSERTKNYLDKYEVNVPYNRDAESIMFGLDGNVLAINIRSRSEDKNQTTECTIPEDVNINKMTQKYDEVNQIMYFSFPKKF